MVKLFAAVASIASLSAVVANLEVLSPGGSDEWWVANSQNVLVWNCHDPGAIAVPQFNVWINNSNPQVFHGPQAVIAQQSEFVCSLLVGVDQVNQPAGTGYTILFTDIVNVSNVFAVSQAFEIKPQNSAYPATTVAVPPAPSSGSASGTGTSSAGGSTKTGTSSASSLDMSLARLGVAAFGAILGLVMV